MEAAQGNEYYALFLLLARTGMWPGEAFALQWSDLDFTNRKIPVERALSPGEIGTTKTDSIRSIDMSKALAVTLASPFEQREALTEGEPHEHILVNEAGGLLDESRTGKQFKRVMRQAGVSGHRLYDLRHTFATALLAKGAPITYVAHQLGHAKPTTTLQCYTRWLFDNDGGYVHLLDGDAKNLVPNRNNTPTATSMPDGIAANLKGIFGALSETRTPDPLIKSQLLYQLS